MIEYLNHNGFREFQTSLIGQSSIAWTWSNVFSLSIFIELYWIGTLWESVLVWRRELIYIFNNSMGFWLLIKAHDSQIWNLVQMWFHFSRELILAYPTRFSAIFTHSGYFCLIPEGVRRPRAWRQDVKIGTELNISWSKMYLLQRKIDKK